MRSTLTTAKRGTLPLVAAARVGGGGGGGSGGGGNGLAEAAACSPQRRQAAARLAFFTLIVVYEFHTRGEGRRRLLTPGGRRISGSWHSRNQEQSPAVPRCDTWLVHTVHARTVVLPAGAQAALRRRYVCIHGCGRAYTYQDRAVHRSLPRMR